MLGHAADRAGLVAVLRSAAVPLTQGPLPPAGDGGGPDGAWDDAGVVLVACNSRDKALRAYLEPAGVIAGARPDQLVVDIGGLDPLTTGQVAEAARAAGKRLVDVRPVADGLACWAGPSDAWSGHESLLRLLGAADAHVGDAGAASIAAAITAQVALTNLAGSQEGLVLGVKAGMGSEPLTRVIAMSSGASPSLTAPLRQPQVDGAGPLLTVEAARAQLEHALDLGRAQCVPTPLAALTHGWLQSLCRQGSGGEPVAALGDLLRGLAGHAAAPPPVDASTPGARANRDGGGPPDQPQGRVGFIGLGRIGRPMATSILRSGLDLMVHNRSRPAVEELAGLGARAASGARQIAEECDVVVTCLPDNQALELVYWGDDGLLPGVHAGQELIDGGTSSLALTLRIAEAVRERGGLFADAPVSGGLDKAAAGELTIMVGAREAMLSSSHGVLAAMGSELFFLDEVGRGQITKQVNNMLNATNFAAACEGLALAVAGGLRVEAAFDLLSRPQLASFACKFRGGRVLRGDYAPTYTTLLRVKDSLAALELGQEFRVPLPLCALVHELFEATVAMGSGGDDWTALARVYESLAGVSLSAGAPAPAQGRGGARP